MTLGVMDWGVGGFFAAAYAVRRQPGLDIVYRADTGNTPYGLQTRGQLAVSVQAGLDFLADQGATHIIIACHSGSTALRDVEPPVPTWGVIDASPVPVQARKVLVLGGARTIRCGHWRRALHALPGSRQVVQRISQPLSAHVEAGAASSPECMADLDRILAPARDADCVVLACTHYAALSGAISERMPRASLVDPALSVVDQLDVPVGSGQFRASTSGDFFALLRAGEKALGEQWYTGWRKGGGMPVKGTFDIQLEPQTDVSAPAGRMVISKQYSGSLVGIGTGQMLSKRTDSGFAVYSAIEEFEGSLDGKAGGFTLVHVGTTSKTSESLDVVILQGSGTGDLAGISGKMSIVNTNGRHHYELDVAL